MDERYGSGFHLQPGFVASTKAIVFVLVYLMVDFGNSKSDTDSTVINGTRCRTGLTTELFIFAI